MFKENLMSALKKAVALHNDGAGDNDAVVKSAAEYEFNPDQTQRLVETYNTAKTICFYKTAADRTGKFGLADGSAVIRQLFDGKPSRKEASGLHDYGCYDAKMDFVEVGMEIKAASAETAKDPWEGVSLDNRIYAMQKNQDDIRLAEKKAEDTASMCALECQLEMDNMVNSVNAMDKAAEAIACMRALCVTDMYKTTLEDFEARFPQAVKNAASDVDFTTFDLDRPDVISSFQTTADLYVKHAMFKAYQLEMTKLAEQVEQDIRKLYVPRSDSNFSDVFTPVVKDMMAGSVKYAQSSGKGKTPSIMDPLSVIGGGMAKGLQDTTKTTMQDTLGEMASDDESARLTEKTKNLHRKFILEKLITTDPVLKGVPQEDVARAYQTIVQIAPEVSLNEEVSRSILRTATSAQSISPYDAKTFVDLDSAIRAQLEQQGGKKPVKKQVTA